MQKIQRQIIALGGGGMSMEPEESALDLYVLAQTHNSYPAVCFLPTASGDADSYIAKFYSVFSRYTCRPSHLTFFQRTPDLRTHLLKQDVIYVGGGNTRSMLAVWREWALPKLLKEAWESGVILAGISAGAICWFEQGLSDSVAGKFIVLDCLGFLEGSCTPHYDGEPERRSVLHKLLLKREILPGYAIDDGVAIHFVGLEAQRAVSSRPNAKAYRLFETNSSIEEVPIDVEYIAEEKSG